jgi:putative ABC transport system permease protein
LGVTLVVLVLMALAAARIGRLPVSREIVTAAIRAVAQLAAVSTIIALVLGHVWSSLLFVGGMFAIAVWVASGRAQTRHDWMWVAAALAIGAVPVLTAIFVIGAATFTGPAIIPIAGIVIGNSMTAHTLSARRAFDQLRDGVGQVEAGLALGMARRSAIDNVIHRHAHEALLPVLDQTRTVGLVTLPGAFIGVLLGGGSAADAAAAQILVLIGLIAAQTIVVGVVDELIARGRIMPVDIRDRVPAA